VKDKQAMGWKRILKERPRGAGLRFPVGLPQPTQLGLLWHRAACLVVLCFFLGAFTGCGSQESASPERKNNSHGSASKTSFDEQGKSSDGQGETTTSGSLTTIKADKPSFTATPPRGNSTANFDSSGEQASTVKLDIDKFEVIPAAISGQQGVTQAKIKALMEKQSSNLAPELLEVIPPAQPGQPGITQAEISMARQSLGKLEIEADQLEVTPPGSQGQPGATRAEIDAVVGLEGDVKSGSFEAAPPEIPGGNGLGLAEAAALGTLQPHGNIGFMPLSKIPSGK